MKKLMISALLILSSQAFAGRLPVQLIPMQHPALTGISQLTHFNLQKDTALGKGLVSEGEVTVNLVDSIKLTLEGNVCPKNAMCLVGPTIYSFEAKFQTIEKNACGATVYHGETDLRPVDGTLTDIIVVDNSTATCKTLVALPATEVILTTQSLRQDAPEKHYMTGTSLAFPQMM